MQPRSCPPADGIAAANAASNLSTGRPGPESRCEPYRLIILAKLKQELTAHRIWQDLVEQGFTGRYASAKRFVHGVPVTQDLSLDAVLGDGRRVESMMTRKGVAAPALTAGYARIWLRPGTLRARDSSPV